MNFQLGHGVPPTEVCVQFIQGMFDAMSMSFFKYGRVADAYPNKVDAIASLRRRLSMYEQTGNKSWLIDIANFAMIEFQHPLHKDAHYRPTDSKESPGRKWHGDTFSQKGNKDE